MSMEIVGYLASVSVMTSLLMGNVVWLRIINTVGCVLFVIYGMAVEAYPVVLLNALCVFINIYHLIKLKKQQALTTAEA